MEKTQQELINASKTSVHEEVKALNEQEDKQSKLTASADNPLVGLSAGEIEARLDAMSVEELKQAVRLSNAALGGVLLATPEEIAQQAKLELARVALTPIIAGTTIKSDIANKLAAIDKFLDRQEGKPKASLDVTGKIGIVELVLAMPSYSKEKQVLENGEN